MLYLMGEYIQKLSFLKSIYLRTFIAFMVGFIFVLVVGKPFIKYLKCKKFGEKIRTEGPDRKSVRVGKECRSRWSPYH